MLGYGWSSGGNELDVSETRLQISGVTSYLRALDLVERDGLRLRAGPSALTLLPRATLLAEWLPKMCGSQES